MNTEPISAAEAERILITCDGAGKEAKREALARLVNPLRSEVDRLTSQSQTISARVDALIVKGADSLIAKLDETEAELAVLKAALAPLAARIEDELKSGRPALIAVQWFRLEPIAKALGIATPTNPAPLP